MTSKRISRRSLGRVDRHATGDAAHDRPNMIFDITLSRVEAFNRENGGGVTVRRLANGYTLIRDDTGEPIARLRSRDEGRQYEVLRRDDAGRRWQAVGLAGMILPLDDALEFIADDPLGCFWR